MTREDVLDAVKEASLISDKYQGHSKTYFDLIPLAEELEIPVLFRPLNDMWGGAVTVEEKSGILIKSNLPRDLQRFTLAHEIGHILLGHKNHFDEEVGLSQRATGRSGRPVEEIAADTFASEILAPLDLIRKNAKRQSWSKKDLQDPNKVYQLSLRLGISFQATCWALVDNNIIEQTSAREYANEDGIVKQIKNSFVPFKDVHNPYADVWSLTEADSETMLRASEDDMFLITLEERSSAGYCWEVIDSDGEIEMVIDEKDVGDKYGSFSNRTIGFNCNRPGVYTLSLSHRRPWNGEEIQEITFSIDNRGREKKGLPRMVKQASLAGVNA